MSVCQKFIRNVVYPLNLWTDGEWSELQYRRALDKSQYFSSDELYQLRWHRLQGLLSHAYRFCPYYRTTWDKLGLVPSDVRKLSDLAQLPIVTKSDIQLHRDKMVANNWRRDDLLVNQTGGSTGAPISFYQSIERTLAGKAAAWRHNCWAGYDTGDKVAMIWGASRDIPANTWKHRVRNLLLDRAIWLDTGYITEEKLRLFHESLKTFRPKTILAYARAVTLFARYLKGHSLQAYQPQSIITSAEVLEPADRALVQEVFGCAVFDRYGCREVGVLASECEVHSGMHIMAEGLYLEVVTGTGPASPGAAGKVLVTDLLNYPMPLIRYEIGDVAALEPAACACGRTLPRLRGITGRVTDFVVGSEGQLVSGVFLATYVIAKRPTLGQVQLWQELPNQVLYKIAPGKNSQVSHADLEFLTNETQRYLGRSTEVEYEFVDELLPESSGKFIFCRSSASCSF